MSKSRLEAFSDGVIAIIITIMVLELKVPHGTSLSDLRAVLPVFLAYVLSFLYVGIYWNNHHHLLHAAQRVSGSVLWANLHLLFWLSLIPFTTGWLGENHVESLPAALYGAILFAAGVAYVLLQRALLAANGADSLLGRAVGRDRKGIASLVLYAIAIAAAFLSPWLACALYLAVALLWFIPDRRIERTLHAAEHHNSVS
jgi:uncharacterized membrane protein